MPISLQYMSIFLFVDPSRKFTRDNDLQDLTHAAIIHVTVSP